MRVLVLAKASAIHTARWVNVLAERGHEITLASIHPFSQPLSPLVQQLKLPYSPPLGYFLGAKQLKRIMGETKPDLLHVHFASGYGTLARLSGFHPALLSVWGSDVYDFPQRGAMFRALLRGNLRYADLITSTSHTMAAQTRKIGGADLDIEVIAFGVDSEVFSPEMRVARGEVMRIGTVKALSKKYGIDTLIRAYALVWKDLRDRGKGGAISLDIFGDGPDRLKLQRIAAEEVPDGSVQFRGSIPHAEVPLALRNLDIFVALSRLESESFGVSIVEAAACGLPVVAAAIGGLREVVVDGTTGILVPPEDPEAAAGALRRLIENPRLRVEMGRAGRAFAQRTYEWSECVDKMEAVFARMRSRSTVNAELD